jgi:hypothetical protein
MFTEDLTPFFNTAEFAIAATIGATAVPVIFDAAFLASLGVAGTNPAALAKTSDSAAAVGATIVISGASYIIRGREPQDDGAVVLLQLEKQ